MKQFLLMFVGVCFFSCSLYAQTSQPEKKKIKVQLFVDGKLHPFSQTLTRADKEIQLRVYDAVSNKELAVALVEASLIRNGQKIASVTLPGIGSIEKLVMKAKNNDNYVFDIKQVLEMADDLTLKPFSQKSFKVSYWFFDTQIDASKVAVGTN
ncbi:hypothetical protein EMA8858_00715 [Emticicia aquatica]|jgi:hypothetical protein|uniref:Uncharacterized protein n=1 Tax=Emticicia aquatica TaxID=1681835 RepID=A0ABN8EPM4_9BACT|nr:hypothetical protein [Emticicia aquatica]CAH0994605.1 hypothetical protein EMA8858_00715 [Emticicia aquatica]